MDYLTSYLEYKKNTSEEFPRKHIIVGLYNDINDITILPDTGNDFLRLDKISNIDDEDPFFKISYLDIILSKLGNIDFLLENTLDNFEINISLEYYKSYIIRTLKDYVHNQILLVYPYWKQNNIIDESKFAINKIYNITGLNDNAIIQRCIDKIDAIDATSTSEYKIFRDEIYFNDSIDLSDLVNDAPIDKQDELKEYYKPVIYHIIMRIIIDRMRAWNNNRENDINNMTFEDIISYGDNIENYLDNMPQLPNIIND